MPFLDESVTSGESGRLSAHAALKGEYDAAGASPALPAYTNASSAALHAAIHNILHARHNALGETPALPTNLTATSTGCLAYETALNAAYNRRQNETARYDTSLYGSARYA